MTSHRSHRMSTPRRSRAAGAAALAALAALGAAALGPAAGAAAPAKGPQVSTATTGLGRVLVGPSGHTLYLFAKDANGKSACTGMCATFWPPLIASGKPLAGTGARAALLGTTRRADGRMQVTYNHHPVYGFAKDTKKGQTNGQGVEAFGAAWYVTSPAGARITKGAGSSGGTTAPAPATTPTTTPAPAPNPY